MNKSDLLKRIKSISRLTNFNNHCEARIKGCKLLSDLGVSQAAELMDQYKVIQAERDRLGHMPYPLYTERTELDKQFWKLANAKFGGDLYRSFYGAY